MLLLGQPCCHSHTESGTVAEATAGLDDPKLLCACSDVHVEACTPGDLERARAVRCNRIDSYRSAVLMNIPADVHRAEGDGERTISVELNTYQQGFRHRISTEVLVAVEGPDI